MTVAQKPSASIQATFDHVDRLALKIATLNAARLESERQVLHRIGQEFAAGRLTWQQLAELYEHVRVSFAPGFSKRWDEAVSAPARTLINSVRNRPNGPHDTWVGTLPVTVDAPAPMDNHSVVYVLYDAHNTPAYVGSTSHFRGRMKTHRSKRLATWQAHPCDDREHAYVVEDRLLKEHKPYLNKRAGR